MPDTIDQISNIVDVVAEKHTSKKRDSYDKKSLNVVSCMQIPETNGQNNSCSEIVTPNVLLIPRSILNPSLSHPSLWQVHIGNRDQQTTNQMTNEQIQS